MSTSPATIDQPESERVVALAAANADAIVKAPYATRAGWLDALADMLTVHASELVSLADSETQLGEPRLVGELARTSAQLRRNAELVRRGEFLEAVIDHPNPAAIPPSPDLRRMLVPIGPVVVFAASNFPFAFSVLGGDTASALAAGNPVIVKAHEGHPRLSRRVADLAQEALSDAPAGLLGIVEGRDAGVELVKHPQVRAVGFTGSVAGGRFLFNVAAARPEPIPFYGELGSINPVVVTEAAVRDRGAAIASGLAGSFTLGMGQFCTKPGLVLVPAGYDFAQSVASNAGTGRARMLNDRIEAGYLSRLAQVMGGGRVQRVGESDPSEQVGQGPVVLRTTAADVRADPGSLLDEVFGPSTLIVEYSDDEDLHQTLPLLPGSLTATVHAAPGEDVSGLVSELTSVAGRVLFGGWPTGVAVTAAQHHGGPYPAATSIHTSVGDTAIRRFLRPISFQTFPDELLPPELQEANPLHLPRRIDGTIVMP